MRRLFFVLAPAFLFQSIHLFKKAGQPTSFYCLSVILLMNYVSPRYFKLALKKSSILSNGMIFTLSY